MLIYCFTLQVRKYLYIKYMWCNTSQFSLFYTYNYDLFIIILINMDKLCISDPYMPGAKFHNTYNLIMWELKFDPIFSTWVKKYLIYKINSYCKEKSWYKWYIKDINTV